MSCTHLLTLDRCCAFCVGAVSAVTDCYYLTPTCDDAPATSSITHPNLVDVRSGPRPLHIDQPKERVDQSPAAVAAACIVGDEALGVPALHGMVGHARVTYLSSRADNPPDVLVLGEADQAIE